MTPRLPCAKAEGGDSTGSIVEGYPRIAKVVALYHCFTPPILIRRRRASLQCRDQFGRGEDRVGGCRPVQLSTACIISCENAAVKSVTRVT